jgi:hypothetical protein
MVLLEASTSEGGFRNQSGTSLHDLGKAIARKTSYSSTIFINRYGIDLNSNLEEVIHAATCCKYLLQLAAMVNLERVWVDVKVGFHFHLE